MKVHLVFPQAMAGIGAGLKLASYVLVRPDGYVAASGTDQHLLGARSYLTRWTAKPAELQTELATRDPGEGRMALVVQGGIRQCRGEFRGDEMSTITHGGRFLHRRSRLPASVISLALLLTLLFVGAFQGGVAMVTDPTHPLGMSTDWLQRAPVDTYFWPGVLLLALALASLLAVVGLLLDWPWRWAGRIERQIGFRWPWLVAIATGVVLFIFEIIELFVVPFHPVMHPLLVTGSVAIIGFVFSASTRAHLRVD